MWVVSFGFGTLFGIMLMCCCIVAEEDDRRDNRK